MMKLMSLWPMASSKLLVARSRARDASIKPCNCGSSTGARPSFNAATYAALTSIPITSNPFEANTAAIGEPSLPSPTTDSRGASLLTGILPPDLLLCDSSVRRSQLNTRAQGVGISRRFEIRRDGGRMIRRGRVAGPGHLPQNPGVRATHPVLEPNRGCPVQPRADQRVVAVPTPYAFRGIDLIPALERHPGNLLDHANELIDADQLIAADVERLVDVTLHEAERSIHAIVDVCEAAGLLPVAPDVDDRQARQLGLNNLSANRRGRLLAPTLVSPKRSVDVVIPAHSRGQPEIFREVPAHPLAEQLFPPVTILRHRGVRI